MHYSEDIPSQRQSDGIATPQYQRNSLCPHVMSSMIGWSGSAFRGGCRFAHPTFAVEANIQHGGRFVPAATCLVRAWPSPISATPLRNIQTWEFRQWTITTAVSAEIQEIDAGTRNAVIEILVFLHSQPQFPTPHSLQQLQSINRRYAKSRLTDRFQAAARYCTFHSLQFGSCSA